MPFLRYRAKYYHEQNDKIQLGFFWAADYLQKHGNLEKEDRKKLEELIHFFDHKLPIPEYYQDEKNRQLSKSATSWFKDSAKEFIKRMNELARILEHYNVDVERINVKELPGKKIYEDDYQVTIIPFRESRKSVS